MLITGLVTGYGPAAGRGGYGPPSRRHVGVEVYLHSVLISKSDESERSASRPSPFTPADKNLLSRRFGEDKVLCLRRESKRDYWASSV